MPCKCNRKERFGYAIVYGRSRGQGGASRREEGDKVKRKEDREWSTVLFSF